LDSWFKDDLRWLTLKLSCWIADLCRPDKNLQYNYDIGGNMADVIGSVAYGSWKPGTESALP